MITLNAVVNRTSGLNRQDLERWILESWVKPERDGEEFLFQDIDVARVRLIVELRDALDVDELALPIVLSLIDQVYDLRRRMRALIEALGETVTDQTRQRPSLRI